MTVRGALLILCCALACGAPERQQWVNTYDGDGEDLFVLDDDLACLADESWVTIDKTRLANPLGHLEETVQHANDRAAGAFPIGTIIQLLPDEVFVKRGAGFSPDTLDWEFLKLHVGSGRTVITERGTSELNNPGGTCLSCHSAARAFDLVCFTNNTCAPLPFFVDTDIAPQDDDPRCR